jgi:hypothetical protein
VPVLDSAPSWSINHVHTVGKAFTGKEFLLAVLPSPPHRWFTVCRLRFVASLRLRDWSITSNRETSTKQDEKILVSFYRFFLFQSNSKTPHHELVEWFPRKLPPASLSRVPRSLPGTRPPWRRGI